VLATDVLQKSVSYPDMFCARSAYLLARRSPDGTARESFFLVHGRRQAILLRIPVNVDVISFISELQKESDDFSVECFKLTFDEGKLPLVIFLL
jgi:hypothetical protein